MTTEIDVNTDGPVVEEVLNHQIRFENLKYFMKDQCYTKHEVNTAVELTKTRSNEILSRTIARL